MIAKLKGRLEETGTDWAVIDVSGVGYLIHCSAKTLAALGEAGEAVSIFTDLQVSENDLRLLGFATAAERDWFRILTQVQGWAARSRWRSCPRFRPRNCNAPARKAMPRWLLARTGWGRSWRARPRMAGPSPRWCAGSSDSVRGRTVFARNPGLLANS